MRSVAKELAEWMAERPLLSDEHISIGSSTPARRRGRTRSRIAETREGSRGEAALSQVTPSHRSHQPGVLDLAGALLAQVSSREKELTMNKPLALTLLTALICSACGGGEVGGESSTSSNICQQAASHFEKCTGRKIDRVPQSCDPEKARAILATKCGGRSAQAFVDDLCSLLSQLGITCTGLNNGNILGNGTGAIGGAGSCAGACGSQNDMGGCYCNSDCVTFGDCCADFTTTCGGAAGVNNGAVGGAGSCAGQCGSDAGASGCYCDTGCAQFGDCCADYTTVCGGAAGTGVVGGNASCAGACGSQNDMGGCYCDTTCSQFGDCCADYNTTCGGIGTNVTGTGSCSGACGSQNDMGGCYCDTACTTAGNCCADYNTFCAANNTNTGTCSGKCGSTADAGGCYCDTECSTFGDCCSDYKTACP
jgi:hypothetical protein